MPSPPFFQKLLAPDLSCSQNRHNTAAVPFIDSPSPRRAIAESRLSHAGHVTQNGSCRPEQVMEGCFRALTVSSLWMRFRSRSRLPTGRTFTANSADVFSLEHEVREWLRTGRYHKAEAHRARSSVLCSSLCALVAYTSVCVRVYPSVCS